MDNISIFLYYKNSLFLHIFQNKTNYETLPFTLRHEKILCSRIKCLEIYLGLIVMKLPENGELHNTEGHVLCSSSNIGPNQES